jgi:ABC-type nitrate/sulfonate/bicarbonate transport system substrate-binding protein
MTPERNPSDVVRKPPGIPWLRLATTVLLAGALAISVAAGRTVDSIIIGVLLVPSVALLIVRVFAWRRGLLADER